MGNKKECICGYWNQAQQECLYSGYGCVRDEGNKPEATEEYIMDKVITLFVFLNILKPSSNDERNAKTFVRSLLREG